MKQKLSLLTMIIVLTYTVSAIAANKVVVVPLFSRGSGDDVPTVKSKTGRIWMDRNLGAYRVAQSKDDYQAYGWLYQWGRLADGHEVRSSPETALNHLSNGDVPGHEKFIIVNALPWDWRKPQNNTLWEGKNGKNNPCPKGFRLPTVPEWQAEIVTWSTKDDEGAYTSRLKLPKAGVRHYDDGTVYESGYSGRYWSSEDYSIAAFLTYFDKYQVISNDSAYRSTGCSVRCIQD